MSAEEITELLNRYCIGKKPLSKLLGFGETTILRYTEGIRPNGAYEACLKQIYTEPQYYLKLLEENKDRITPVAYKKSKNAVLLLLADSKLVNGASYLYQLSGNDISPLRLVMTLFYAEAFSLGLKGISFLNEVCDISEEGIPYFTFYRQLCEEKRRSFEAEGMLSSEEKEWLAAVYKAMLRVGPLELKELFLSERAYIKTAKQTDGGKRLRNSSMSIFYRKIASAYRLQSAENFSSYFLERTGRRKRKKPSADSFV